MLDELDEAKIDLICGENDPAVALSAPLDPREEEGSKKPTWAGVAGSVKTFATVTLPALVRRPAAQLPRVGKQVRLATHWRKGRPVRPAAVRHRSSHYRNQLPADNDDRPMLGGSGQDEPGAAASPHMDHSPETQDVTTLGEGDLAQQATPAQGVAIATYIADKDVRDTEVDGPTALVTPHAPVFRDDRPVSHLRYRNPALHAPLLRSLWLPRDPLRAVDLGDTVNLHTAFVSSGGGRGVIGSWDDAETSTRGSGDRKAESGAEMPLQAAATSSSTHDVKLSLSAPPSLRRRRSSHGRPVENGDGEDAGTSDSAELQPSGLPAPILVGEPETLSLGVTAAGAASPAPIAPSLPPSPATPLTKVSTHAVHRSPTEEHSSPAGAVSPRMGPLVSPARSTRSFTLSRILSSGSASTTHSPPPPASSSASSPTRIRIPRTRTSRSGSLATVRSTTTAQKGTLRTRRASSAFSGGFVEAAEEGPEAGEAAGEPVVSNAEAIRTELVEEERRSHLAHAQRDAWRKEKEHQEAEARAGGQVPGPGGLWRKVLLWHDEDVLADDT